MDAETEKQIRGFIDKKTKDDFSIARLSGGLSYGTAAITSLILINGAAALGVLQFLGSLVKRSLHFLSFPK